jgi:trehalose 6-phosphate phosphatase
MPLPTLPPNAALLLDMDGTLIDIARTPDSVFVPPELPPVLRRLRARLGDALAVVTGRPIDQIDALMPDTPFAVAGEHGAAIRHAPGNPIVRADLANPPAAWLEEAERVAAATEGVLLERKAHGFVLHYRMAPVAGAMLRAALDRMLAGHTDRFTIMSALMAWEVKPIGADKATAGTALMAQPPFVGRVPVYIGDDVTDEDGMRAARALGGLGWRVQDVFTDAAGVRAWLARTAADTV